MGAMFSQANFVLGYAIMPLIREMMHAGNVMYPSMAMIANP